MEFPFAQDENSLDTNPFQSEVASQLSQSNFQQQQPSAQTQLMIVNTKTYSQETLSVTGIPQLIHVVIKNSPFYLSIVQQPMNLKGNSQVMDLNQVTFESTLIYDDIGNNPVDYIKTKPVETKFEPSPDGDKMQVECRIKVLSSKHKDMFFRVRLEGFYPGTKNPIPGLSVTSGVIKVISKPEGKKKNEPAAPQVPHLPNNNSSSSKKRSTTESLVDVVTRLEKQQQTQEQIIRRLLESQENKGKELRDMLSEEKIVSKRQKQERGADQNPNDADPEEANQEEEADEDEENLTFEESFRLLIESYNNMTPEEKTEVVRKLIRNSSFRELERVTELLDLFWTSGLEKPALNTANTPTEEDCSCVDCPHKEELEKIDSWYREFLSAPSFQ